MTAPPLSDGRSECSVERSPSYHSERARNRERARNWADAEVGSFDRLAGRNVLVTGGGGFIGSNVTETLAPHTDVTILDDFSSGARGNVEDIDDVSIVTADVRDRAAVEEAVRGQDVIVHLAAMAGVQRTIDNPLDTLEINVEGTRTVLEVALDEGVDRLLFTSTSEVYGDMTTPPYSEDGPIAPKTNYAVAKALNERYVRAHCERADVPYSIVRYFNVYGPNQDGSADGYVVPKFIRLALEDEPIPVYGSGDQTRDFTYVDDAVDATIRALGPAARGETFNVGTGIERSIHTLAEEVADVVDGGEVVHIDDPRPYRVERRCADISKARSILGYEPAVSLRDGIRHVANSMPSERADSTSAREV